MKALVRNVILLARVCLVADAANLRVPVGDSGRGNGAVRICTAWTGARHAITLMLAEVMVIATEAKDGLSRWTLSRDGGLQADAVRRGASRCPRRLRDCWVVGAVELKLSEPLEKESLL